MQLGHFKGMGAGGAHLLRQRRGCGVDREYFCECCYLGVAYSWCGKHNGGDSSLAWYSGRITKEC